MSELELSWPCLDIGQLHTMLSLVAFIRITVAAELLWLLLAGKCGAAQHLDRRDVPHHFVLVHGAGHGAWCWYKVAYLLRRAGHTVDAIDLLSAGINRFDPSAVGTLERYSSPLVEFLEKLPSGGKIVLVGHSLGGATVTYAMERFPDKIAAAVYVAGLMLPSGSAGAAINSQLLAKLPMTTAQSPISTVSFQLDLVKELFYNRSPPEDVELAKLLLKPAPLLNPMVNFTQGNYGHVPRYYIKTMHDNVVLPQDQELLIKTSPPRGVATIDADHAAFFSRPKALAALIAKIADKTFS